jgi:glycine cleavage system protein P-like pyridoxal-binding family
MTLEPTESYSQADLDEYAAILGHIAGEAYEDPEVLHTAPHNSTCHSIDPEPFDDPDQWAVTWRATGYAFPAGGRLPAGHCSRADGRGPGPGERV